MAAGLNLICISTLTSNQLPSFSELKFLHLKNKDSPEYLNAAMNIK